MIIELFGAPGAGKTTFARALVARLRAQGVSARLITSLRPSEKDVSPGAPTAAPAFLQTNAVILRLVRPFSEILHVAHQPVLSVSDHLSTAMSLLKSLPPGNILTSIKRGQYIVRLAYLWDEAAHDRNIVLFDQGFIQTACALALVSGRTDDTILAKVLETMPRSDIVIWISAPEKCLAARLEMRRQGQGFIERLLELDAKTSIASLVIFDRLHDILLQRGRYVLAASSLDEKSLEESLLRIQSHIVGRNAIGNS